MTNKLTEMSNVEEKTDLRDMYTFIGYLIRRKNDKIIQQKTYAGTVRYADNVFVVDYDDRDFFTSFYQGYGIDLYEAIDKLPALVVVNLDSLEYQNDKQIVGVGPNREKIVVEDPIVRILYDQDIIEKYPIFDSDDIWEIYFTIVDSDGNKKMKELRYSEDNKERTVSLGFGEMK